MKLAVLLLVLILATTLIVWQLSRINNLNRRLKSSNSRVVTLEKSNTALSQRASDLSSSLNQANQTISSLTRGDSFVPGDSCLSQQLSLEMFDNAGQGATGHRSQLFDYKNTSNTSCTVKGYPGFLILDSSGHVMPNGPIKTGNDYMFTDPKPKVITLAPKDKSYFELGWDDVDPAPGQYCLNASLIESTPPGNIYPLVTALNQPYQFCNYGMTISALGTRADFSLY